MIGRESAMTLRSRSTDTARSTAATMSNGYTWKPAGHSFETPASDLRKIGRHEEPEANWRMSPHDNDDLGSDDSNDRE